MKTKLNVLWGAHALKSSPHIPIEANRIHLTTHTTAYASTFTRMTVEESRLLVSLLFSYCLSKSLFLPLMWGEASSCDMVTASLISSVN